MLNGTNKAKVFEIPLNNTSNVKQYVRRKIDLFWNYLETLPISPYVSLSIIIFGSLFILICCCCVCCRYWFRRKVKKTKVARKINLQKTCLFGSSYIERTLPGNDEPDYNSDLDSLDSNELIRIGKIKFEISYDSDENILYVTIIEGKDIPGSDFSGLSDTYIISYLIPASKKRYKTPVIKRTKNPVFNHKLRFKRVTYQALKTSYLLFKVMDSDMFSKDDLLGETVVPIIDLDVGKKVMASRMIRKEFKEEKKTKHLPNLGHICIGLAYEPRSNILAIFVLGCKDLPAFDEGGFSDPYIKFWLVQDGKKIKRRKSTVKLRTLNPTYNERFDFEVSFERIDETSLMFIVADYDKGEKGDPIGQLLVGQLGSGNQLKHWKKMQKHPGKPIIKWHKLRPPTIEE